VVGKRFRRAVRLAQTTIGNWDRIDGTYTAQTGGRLLALPVHRLLNLTYVWALDRKGSDEAAEAWEKGLDAPLPGESPLVADEEFDDSYDQINQ
jgi:hypothetical protein